MNPHGRVPVVDDNGTMVWNRMRSFAISRPVTVAASLERRCGATLSVRRWMDGRRARCNGFSQRCVLGLLPHPAPQRDMVAV